MNYEPSALDRITPNVDYDPKVLADALATGLGLTRTTILRVLYKASGVTWTARFGEPVTQTNTYRCKGWLVRVSSVDEIVGSVIDYLKIEDALGRLARGQDDD